MEVPPLIKKWEKDLGMTLEENVVGNVLKATHSSALDIKMTETNYTSGGCWMGGGLWDTKESIIVEE